jgi:hypothetical protein
MRGKASLYEAMAEECIRDEATSLCCELRGYELWCKEVREGIVRPGMHESLHQYPFRLPPITKTSWPISFLKESKLTLRIFATNLIGTLIYRKSDTFKSR